MARERDYRGRCVAITGGAGGLGSALAQAFGAAGARIALLDLDTAKAELLARRLQSVGIDACSVACDLTDTAACRAAMDEVLTRFGRLDLLVNNAGISARCLLRDMHDGVVEQVMAVNFFGAVHATRAALPALLASRGQIVTISSIAGFSPLVGRTAYAASKHALHGFFDSLRSELGAEGVDVTLVCPAFIATGIERAALGADGRPAGTLRQTTGAEATPEAVAARILAAARRGDRLCLPAATSRAAWWVSRLAPALYERLMLRRVGAEFDLAARSSR